MIASHHSFSVGTWYQSAHGPRMAAGDQREAKVPVEVVEPEPPQRLSFWGVNQSYVQVPLVMYRVSAATVAAPSGPATVGPDVTSRLRPHW